MDKKCILIVDDEGAIRRMLRSILGADAYEYIEAVNGNEAQRLIDRYPVDLVISDVIMPDCDGIELVMALRQKHPGLPVIIVSGGGRVRAEHYLNLAQKLGAAKVFEKPFDTVALRAAVRELTECEEVAG